MSFPRCGAFLLPAIAMALLALRVCVTDTPDPLPDPDG